jgi:hypothetical protein
VRASQLPEDDYQGKELEELMCEKSLELSHVVDGGGDAINPSNCLKFDSRVPIFGYSGNSWSHHSTSSSPKSRDRSRRDAYGISSIT